MQVRNFSGNEGLDCVLLFFFIVFLWPKEMPWLPKNQLQTTCLYDLSDMVCDITPCPKAIIHLRNDSSIFPARKADKWNKASEEGIVMTFNDLSEPCLAGSEC